jgi:hypothetical protein
MWEWITNLPFAPDWPAWTLGAAGGAMLALLLTSGKLIDAIARGWRGAGSGSGLVAGHSALRPEDPDHGTLGEWLRALLPSAAKLSFFFAVCAWLFIEHEEALGLAGMALAVVSLTAAWRRFAEQGRDGAEVGMSALNRAEMDSDSGPAANLFFAACGIVMALVDWLA